LCGETFGFPVLGRGRGGVPRGFPLAAVITVSIAVFPPPVGESQEVGVTHRVRGVPSRDHLPILRRHDEQSVERGDLGRGLTQPVDDSGGNSGTPQSSRKHLKPNTPGSFSSDK
jgi:hypothetical protein